MADYVEGYRTYLNEERHASANTLSSYLRDVRQFEQYLHMTEAGDLSQVQQEQIQAYVNWMTARGKSASTVTRSLAALKSFYHYLMEEGVVVRTPVQNVSAAKAERHLPQILTSQEVELLGHSLGSKSGERFQMCAFIHAFIHSSTRYLLSSVCVPGSASWGWHSPTAR